jgi:hypothetical protein
MSDEHRELSFLFQLDKQTEVDVKLHRSGRHPEDIYWSSNPKYVNKAKIAGRQSSGDDSTIYKKMLAEKNAVAKRQAERSRRLARMRRGTLDIDIEELEASLRVIFRAYAKYRVFKERVRFRRAPVFGTVPEEENGVYEIDTLGWQRLVRDAGLLDNSLTANDLDEVFTAVDAGLIRMNHANADVRKRRAAQAAAYGDLRLDFDEFCAVLKHSACLRYPEAKDEDVAYVALLKNYILPNASRAEIVPIPGLDELLSRAAMNEIRARDAMLKRIYAHYATLELYSATTQKITWRVVERLNATLNEDEFLMWLINFEVVPHLMSKAEAMRVFCDVEEANDADEEVGEMLYPAFCELIGQLAITAFANAAPLLLNPLTDITSIVAVKKLVEGTPRELWMLGTLGALFRRRGYFLGPGGSNLPPRTKKHRLPLFDERRDYGPGSKVANQGRMGRATTTRDGSRGWVPGGKSDDVRSPGPGGLRAAYGYQQSPGRVHLDQHMIEHMSLTERARIEKAHVGKVKARSRLLARQMENDMKALGLDLSKGAAEEYLATRRTEGTKSPGGTSSYGIMGLSASEAFLSSAAPAHDVISDRAWADAVAKDFYANDRVAASAEARRKPMPGALAGNPWVPSSPSSYDHSQPERFNLAPSFHARAKYETQVHHPPQDAFDAVIADPNARGTPNVLRTAQTTTFQAPVERAGFNAAAGGVVRRNGARIRVRDDPSKVRNEADSDIVAELKALTLGDESDIEDKLDARDDFEPDSADNARSSPLRGAGPAGRYARLPGIPLIKSPGSRTLPSDPKLALAPGTYGYGLGTSFAKPWDPRPGVGFGTRGPKDAVPIRSPRRAVADDFPAVPHPSIAEVANLDWFEDVRSKALRQRGLPSTGFLSRWGDKLGTKADRMRNEAQMEAIKKGLRATATE